MDDEYQDDGPDPDTDAIEEVLAHAYAIRTLLRPVLLRSNERRRIRVAVRKTRSAQRNAPVRSHRGV